MASRELEVFLGPLVAGAGLWEPKQVIPPARKVSLIVENFTGLLRQQEQLPMQEMRRTKTWIVQIEPESHLDSLGALVQENKIGRNISIHGLSFKDVTTLNLLESAGYRVEHSPVIEGTDVPIIQNDFIQSQLADDLPDSARMLVCRHLFEHATEVGKFLGACRNFVGPSGYLLIEVPNAEPAIIEHDFSEVWDEHISYFTSQTIVKTLALSGFKVLSLKKIHSDGEELLCLLAQASSDLNFSQMVADSDLIESSLAFLHRIANGPRVLRDNFSRLAVRSIVIFGANHRASNLIDIFLPKDMFVGVIDDDPNKQGLTISSRKIPILSRVESKSRLQDPDLVVLAFSNPKAKKLRQQITKCFPSEPLLLSIPDFYKTFCAS